MRSPVAEEWFENIPNFEEYLARNGIENIKSRD